MKIGIAAPRPPRAPGTLVSGLLVLTLRHPGEYFETHVTVAEIKATVERWLAYLTPDERAVTEFRVYARTLAPAGGTRRVRLAAWRPDDPLEPFVAQARDQLARIPIDPAAALPSRREAWVDEDDLFVNADE